MEISLFFGIVAGIIHVVAFITYNKYLIIGSTKPAITPWFLWALGTLINASSYFQMSENIAASIISGTGALMCVLTFIALLFKGKFVWPKGWDYTIIITGIASLVLWKVLDSATVGNLMIIFGASIAFIPIYSGISSGKVEEKPLAWYIWATAFFVATIVVILTFDGKYQNFAYPVSMFFLHLGVGIHSQIKNK